ncbi:S-adenosylmethionine decarboxylase related protein [Fictibacillus barbaricus]|uniref:Homospermidine synthase n=1 Tax=Fictibacillus barbaricus TaxID=182136 RepID=A0ABU1U3K4_9BACL|nr:S-adenosylmethionine decarboxylase related protein [Fictibacillus barbaricus]MDR7073993.1 homospermidine synthase [Fictibacillus barbaricus]
MTQLKTPPVITLLGSGGGVAKAILALLNQSVQDKNDPIYNLIRLSNIHLIDLKQKPLVYFKDLYPNLINQLIFHEFDLNNLDLFREHLTATKTNLVIDVSWADTVEMLSCCNELGVSYINTALENRGVDEDETLYGFPLAERIISFESNKEKFTNTTAIVGSGMNPGVVQWMAHKLIHQSSKPPIACYIVEHDTSFFKDQKMVDSKTLCTAWSVECFLDEAILSYPMYVSHHIPLYLYEQVYQTEYTVKLGNKEFKGCLMPHEEVLSLGKLYDMEIGFLYRVNEHTTQIIRDNLHQVDDLWDWNHQLIDPSLGEIEGEDLVGVLLVYDDHEEYIYNVMNTNEIYSKFQTNATYFQVACGLFGGIASLLLDSLPSGAHYVDELLLKTNSKYGDYLSYHMKDFVTGKNEASDGLLHQRLNRIQK